NRARRATVADPPPMPPAQAPSAQARRTSRQPTGRGFADNASFRVLEPWSGGHSEGNDRLIKSPLMVKRPSEFLSRRTGAPRLLFPRRLNPQLRDPPVQRAESHAELRRGFAFVGGALEHALDVLVLEAADGFAEVLDEAG